MNQCTIFDIRRFSVNDGPGIRTSVFFKGCPLNCWWCHNPESRRSDAELFTRSSLCVGCGTCEAECGEHAIDSTAGVVRFNREACVECFACAKVCPVGAREVVGQTIGVEELLAEIERDAPFYSESGGGVTFTGGEPLAQPEALRELLRACRKKKIHTVVDTSGYVGRDSLRACARWTDVFLYDLKMMNPFQHEEVTGVDNTVILENLRYLARTGASIVVRIPIIPGVNDSKANAVNTADFIRALPKRVEVELLPFHKQAVAKHQRLGSLLSERWARGSETSTKKMKEILCSMGLIVNVGERRTA